MNHPRVKTVLWTGLCCVLACTLSPLTVPSTASPSESAPPLFTGSPSPASTGTRTASPSSSATPSSTPRPTDFISDLLRTPLGAGRHTFHGYFTFQGESVSQITDILPVFSATGSTGAFQTALYNPANGRYILPNAPEDLYHLTISFFPDGRKYPLPGDLASQSNIGASGPSPLVRQDLEVHRNVHLLAPFDNADPMPQPGFQIFPAGQLEFRWEPLPGACRYQIKIREVDGTTYTPVGFPVDIYTTGTSFKAELYSIPEDHFFGVLMYASDCSTGIIGELMGRLGSSGYGWEYRFRMQ